MSCKNICRLCPNLIISESVVFTAGTGLIINIPEGSYRERCRYCIVVAQAIPDATTINSLVYITIGDGTELYPLNQCDGAQVTAISLERERSTALEFLLRQLAVLSIFSVRFADSLTTV